MTDTLLLIDDDINFLTVIQMQLEDYGYKVVTARNSKIGWKVLEQSQPDIILVDWVMPDISGVELVKLIRSDNAHRDRYIIMVTGRSETKDTVEGLDAGADDYIIKPFQIEELLARIRCGIRIRSLEKRIAEETKQLTIFDMTLSVADKIGNPIAGAKLYQQLLEEKLKSKSDPDILESIKSLGQLLNEALELMDKLKSIKTPQPDSKADSILN